MNYSRLIPIILQLPKLISPELRAELSEGLNRMETRAKQTKNIFDDIFVTVLRGVLDA